MIIREQLFLLEKRLSEKRQFIQVLAGPRQVGKTTLVSQLVERMSVPVTSVTADGVDENNAEWIADQWNAVRVRMYLQAEKEHILIIDEVHKLKRWSEIVKREWDADTKNNVAIKLVILGSSRLMLKDGLKESLAGRFELIRMPHWSFKEMEEAFGFTLEQYIYYGGYPGAALLIGAESRWRKYVRDSIVSPAIEKDVLLTKTILKPALLRQLFLLGCAYSGELLAFNKVAGQLQDAGNTSTLANYLHTLGEAHLLCGLQKYAADEARKYQSVPKYQVYNTALMTVCKGRGLAVDMADRKAWGRWVESAVGAHLMNYAEEENYRVYYWRNDKHAEVDFVLQRADKVIAIEVKSGRRIDNDGLHQFASAMKPDLILVVGSGGLPLDVFLRSSVQDLFSFAR